jgi:hypothetical protein
MKKEIQIRGNCQCCGREQAVVGGLMSKHGYTVEHGWFSGVCSGNHYQPMQFSRVETDSIVSDIRAEIPKLLALADQYESGIKTPEFVMKKVLDTELRKWVEVKVPFAEAHIVDQKSTVSQIVWGYRNRANAGKSFAATLESIANKVHGTPLIEVAKKEVEPIRVGDKKKNQESGTVYTCFKIDGVRVYWSAARACDGKVMRSWMGSQAWRKLATV